MEDMLHLLLLLTMGGTGAYALYSVIRLQIQQYLFPNRFLYPSNCKPEDCTDVDGYITFITPRLYIFAISCLLVAALMLLAWVLQLFALPSWMDTFVLPLIGILCFAYYIVIQNKVFKNFW